MTTELQLLVFSALLSIVLALPPLVALIVKRGLPYASGNRDEGSELPGFIVSLSGLPDIARELLSAPAG